MRRGSLHAAVCGTALAGTAVILCCADAAAGDYHVLYNFAGGKDGAEPQAGLTRDAAGNLYGTTSQGGANGDGVAFSLAPDGTYTVLHAFKGSDGRYPAGELSRDADGNFSGTATYGGAHDDGVFFRMTAAGAVTVVHSFTDASDGGLPLGRLAGDADGNLYGTASAGGTSGHGVIYRVATDGTLTVLHSFDGDEGSYPDGGLELDDAGNLYGATLFSRFTNTGAVFQLAPDGTLIVRKTFHNMNRKKGAFPYGGVVRDAAGNLYGATEEGGDPNCNGSLGCGVVYRIAPSGKFKLLHAFADGPDGGFPVAGLLRTGKRTLYGTTSRGGGSCDCGTLFRIASDGTFSVLHTFAGGKKDGAQPVARLIEDENGNLYGTTSAGGSGGSGVVFSLSEK